MELKISSLRILEEEFKTAKIKLSEIEENLKIEFNFSPIYKDCFAKRAKVDEFNKLERRSNEFEESSDEFEESSDESEDSHEISIHSVVKSANNQSRRDIIRGQNVNPKVESRNRRILGMLQGTLLKFKDEAEKKKPQELKRVEIEQKVEAAVVEEREKQKKIRKDLLQERKDKQSHLSCLEEMIYVTESFESWEKNQKNLLNFIITETGPPIYFLPLSYTSRTKKQHEKSKANVLGSIRKRKMQLNEELAEIKKSHLKK